MINWKRRSYGLLSVFFYGYGAGFGGILSYGVATQPLEISLMNLLIFPSVSGLVAVWPKLGKTFAEMANNE